MLPATFANDLNAGEATEGGTHTNLEVVDPLFWVFKPFIRRPFPIKARNPHIYIYYISSTFGGGCT